MALLAIGLLIGTVAGCRDNTRRSPIPVPSADSLPSGEWGPEKAPCDFQGVVRDRRGTPLPDVLVIAWPKGKRGEAVAQARTDVDGKFLIPGMRTGRWMLLVEAGGLGTLETERQIPDDGDAVLPLDGESRSLTGVVADVAGRPQPGARVILGSPSLRWTRAARSDPNGIFVFDGLGNGRFTLRASLADKSAASTIVVLDETAARPPHVRLTLQQGVYVQGRVVDESGRPLVGAAVDVLAMPSDDLPLSSEAGRDGVFRLGPVAPGRYQILARMEDFVLVDAPEPQLGARPRETFELRLVRTARVSGRVLDESGHAMAGVQVSAIALVGGRDDLVVVTGALPLAAEAAELPVGRLLRPGGARTSPTDSAGRFLVTGLSPGRARIEILHPDKLTLRREPLLLAPGENRDLGDLTIQAGAMLSGKVIDEQGNAVEGAVVEARLAGKGTGPFIRATTDRNGEFFQRVPLGDYALGAGTESRATVAPLPVRVRADVAADACVLRLAPRPLRR